MLLVALFFVASVSFFHSVQFLSTTQDHAMAISLKEFKQGGSVNIMQAQAELTAPETSVEAIDNPVIVSGKDTFSACVLVMDDNHRLVEWLAYHFHVLPLRYLVLAVDPRSKTSPTLILNRWREMGLYVEEWTDYQFMRKDLARNVVTDEAELHIKRDRHRMRQKNFFRQCLIDMKQANRTYTMLIDTDEFLTYNHQGRDLFEAWETKQKEAHMRSQYSDRPRIRPSHAPPTTAEPGMLIQYIRQEEAAGNPFFKQGACISCPRLQFGSVESTQEERQQNIPSDFDSWNLGTLRFRKHAFRNDFVKNGLAKVIIDVSRMDLAIVPKKFQTLHRPIKTICKAPWNEEWESGLRINHYLGSWEGKSFMAKYEMTWHEMTCCVQPLSIQGRLF
jgi:hypothetical protein